MATISENLQTIKDSTDAIKQAIIDKGGTISGDITTWADAILNIPTTPAGPVLISFIISGSTFGATQGMTWGEWIDSDYNPGMYQLGGYEPTPSGIAYRIEHMAGYLVYHSSGMLVYSNEEIVADAVYSQKK